ncbi:hypothetical protein ACG2F4_03810 [Halalkalibaculum sp. DA3122]|uniref:hypothetical protein n=1 Tax=unclassified Halalkalibaculum TaxID=2964617 RepID=UPI0037540E90
MKKIASVALLIFTLTVISHTAHAQNDGIGLGGMINGPTGISYKAWLNEDMALSGGMSFSIGDLSTFYMHTDFVVHGNGEGNLNLESGLMRLYYGFGGRIDYNDVTDDVDFGIRFPLGSSYQFEAAPADVFFELAPTILFNDFNFGLNGALGFRYYLN